MIDRFKSKLDQFRFLKIFLQPLCFIGGVIAMVGFGASCVSLAADLFSPHHVSAYQGLFTFMLYPGVMFSGLGIFVLGVFVEKKRRQRLEMRGIELRTVIDLAKQTHRIILYFMLAGSAVFCMISITGAYRAYEFTESVEFCGNLCHTPMGPQQAAHSASPHARVACVECHVGPGVDDYIKAKLSGLRQVYQVATDSFERPIHSPHSRIPSSTLTCRHCHWSEKFYGLRLDNRVRFGYDLKNSRRFLQMLFKVGGGKESSTKSGSHWHMTNGNKVFFRAVDEKKQTIVWVKVEKPDGSSIEYNLQKEGKNIYPRETLEGFPLYQMDCLDCHNRPAHQFLTPDEAVDRALESGKLDPSLPFIKRTAVKTLAGKYPSQEAAFRGIKKYIKEYYAEYFGDAVLERKVALDEAVAAIQAIYSRNIFPSMNVNWLTYPDNTGHRTSPGCFRCHDGRFRAKDGHVLENSCEKCHIFYEKSRISETLSEAPPDASHLHPFKDKKHYIEATCWDCHSGAASPYVGCKKCHQKEINSEIMTFECSQCHVPGDTTVTDKTCQSCHPTFKSKLHSHKDHGKCLDCHKPHRWKVENHSSCAKCHKSSELKRWGEHNIEDPTLICPGFKGVESHMGGLEVIRKK